MRAGTAPALHARLRAIGCPQAFESGAADAIFDVLKIHAKDDTVISSSTACLSALASNPKFAPTLIERGIVEVMTRTIMEKPDSDLVPTMLRLVENAAASAPERLMAAGGIDQIAAAARSVGNKYPSVAASMVKSLEKISRAEGAGAVMASSGAIKVVLAAAEGNTLSEHPDAVEATLRCVERLSRDETAANHIRDECDGMQKIADAIENHRSSDRIAKMGGRALSRLASSNIEELVKQMDDSSATDKSRQFVSTLIANLATDEENVEKIVASGGLGVLVRALSSTTPKSVASAARAVGRIAERDVLKVEQTNALEQLARAYRQHAKDADVAAAVVDTFNKYIAASGDFEAVRAQGVLPRIVQTLKAEPDFTAHMAAALELLETAAIEGHKLDMFRAEGIAEGVAVAMMVTDASVENIQLNGSRCLIYLAGSQVGLMDIMSQEGISDHVVDLARGADGKASREVVKAALYLVTSMCTDPRHAEIIKSKGGLTALLPVIAANSTSSDLRETCADFVASINAEAEVSRLLLELPTLLEQAKKMKSAKTASALAGAVQSLNALAVVSTNAEAIATAENLVSLAVSISSLAKASGLKGQEQALSSLTSLVGSVYQTLASTGEMGAVERAFAIMKDAKLPEAIITATKLHPKLTKLVDVSLGLVEIFAQQDSEFITEVGGVEACVAALRSNPSSVRVAEVASNTMLQLASTAAGAIAVAKNGGTRQLVASIGAAHEAPEMLRPVEKMLTILNRVAVTSEGAEILRKQDAATTVMDVASTMKGSAVAADATKTCLDRLLQTSDVAKAVDRLDEAVSSGRIDTKTIGTVLSRVGLMSSSSASSATVQSRDGNKKIMAVCSTIMSEMVKSETAVDGESDVKRQRRSDKSDQLRLLLPEAIGAIASLANADTEGIISEETISQVNAALERRLAVRECMDVITAAARTEATASSLVASGGGVLLTNMMDVLRSDVQPEILADAFIAIADLASHATTVDVVAAAGAGALAASWLDANLDDARPETVRSAMKVLASVAAKSESATTMVSGGILDVTKTVVSQFCTDSIEASPEVLASSAQLITALIKTGGAAGAATRSSGAIRRILRATGMSMSYLTTQESAVAVLEMITQCAAGGPEAVTHLASLGAQEMIMAAMNANGSNQIVLDTATLSLRAIGASVDVSILTRDLETTCGVLASAERFGPDMVQDVVQSVQKLGNFMVMEGVVTPLNAGKILDSVSEAVGLIAESELASEDDIAYGLGCVARLAALAPRGTIDTRNAVEVVLDVQDMFSENVKVVKAAVDCFGILTEDPNAVRAMIELGALGEMTKLGARHAGDLGLQATLRAAIGRISAEAAQSAADITASGTQGEQFISQLLDASLGDRAAAQDLLGKVASSTNGIDTLWTMLDRYEASTTVEGEAAASLHLSAAGAEVLTSLATRIEADLRAGALSKATASAPRGQVLAAVLQSAINMRSEIAEDTPEAEQLSALERYRQAMISLTGVTMDSTGAKAFTANKGVENLMQLLEVDIDTMKPYVPMISAGLAQVFAQGVPEAIEAVANETDMELFARAMKELPTDRSSTLSLLTVMSTVVKSKGAAESGVPREVHAFITEEVAPRWAADGPVSAVAREILDLLESRFSSSQQAAVRSSVASALVAIRDASNITVRTDGGTTVYLDSITGAVADGAHFMAMKTRLAEVADAVRTQTADNMIEMDTLGIRSMVNTLRNNTHVAELAKSASEVLSSLSANTANCEAIAAADGIATLIQAYRQAPDSDDLVMHLVLLLSRIARNSAFKRRIIDAGGVDMLGEVLKSDSASEQTLLRALGALADLAHEDEDSIAVIMAAGTVSGVEHAMQRFPKAPRLLENAMTLLSNLTHNSEENMLEIGQTCGDEIAKVVWDFAHDKELTKMALRALGNLANVDENVSFLVQEHSAVDNIKRAINTNLADEELISIAIEVLGNFAAAEVAGSEEEEESIRMHMHSDAATDTIVEAMTANPFSAAVQTACMFALSELLADPVVRSDCNISRIVYACVGALKTHDWDADLIRHAAELVREFPAKGGMDAFVQANGVRLLLQATENHAGSDDVLVAVAKSFAIMCAYQKEVPDIHLSFMSLDAPTVLLGVAASKVEHPPVVAGMFEALAGMSVVEEAATSIAEVGMHTVVTAVGKHMDKPDVIVHALRLVDLISLNKDNINEVVNAGGINMLFDVCVEHGPDEDTTNLPSLDSLEVIKQAVATLSTISSASTDFASLMMEEGLDEVLTIFLAKFDVRTEAERDAERKLLERDAEDNDDDELDVPEDDPVLGALTSAKLTPIELKEVLEKTNHSVKVAALLEDLVRDELTKAAARLEEKREVAERLKAKDIPLYNDAVQKLDAENDRWADADEALDAFMVRAEMLEQLARECRGAMNMMGALDGINKSAALQAKAARSAALAGRDEVAQDEMASVKNSLCVAKLMNVWSKGRSTTFQMLLSEDMENIVWQDASTNAKRGSVSVSSIAKIVDGSDPEHQRGRGLEERRCFYICNPSGTVLALEPINPRTKATWLAKLKLLFDHRGSSVEFTTAAAEAAVPKAGK